MQSFSHYVKKLDLKLGIEKVLPHSLMVYTLHTMLYIPKISGSWFWFSDCVNTVSRKCEYGVLEITSDAKVCPGRFHRLGTYKDSKPF